MARFDPRQRGKAPLQGQRPRGLRHQQHHQRAAAEEQPQQPAHSRADGARRHEKHHNAGQHQHGNAAKTIEQDRAKHHAGPCCVTAQRHRFDHIAPKAGRQNGVEQAADEIPANQYAQGRRHAARAQQNLPAVGAHDHAQLKQEQSHGKPAEVNVGQDAADLAPVDGAQQERH